MPRQHAAKAPRPTAAQNNAHNLTIAKRAVLHYLTTIAAILRHVDWRMDRNALACVRPIDTALLDTRHLFGCWNSGFPSTTRLLNAATRLDEVGKKEPSNSVNALVLEGMAAMCRYIARVMHPDAAARGLGAQHIDLLSKTRRVVDDEAWFAPFEDNRARAFERLLAQLR